MDLFSCPAPSALPTIPTYTCPTRYGQVQKLGFQRIQTSASFNTTTILQQASWTTLLSATDSTKVIVTPYLVNVVITPSEPLKEGGNDNTTLNGVPRLKGLGFGSCTAELHNAPSSVFRALSALTAESASQPGFTNLWVYMFSEGNKIIYDGLGAGIPIYNFSIADVGSEGFGSDNIYKISWDFAPGWSENNAVATAGFNPRTLS